MTDRATLAAAVDSWIIRDDISGSSDFSTMLLVAEAEINRRTRTVIQEKTTQLTFTDREQDLPADFMERRMVVVDGNPKRMTYMTPTALRESSNWSSGRVGAFFTLEGGGGTANTDDRIKMVIAAPASASSPLTVDLLYWARWKKLTASDDSNWLLQNHFDVYLYATLRAAAEYADEDIKADGYARKLEKALSELTRDQHRARFGSGPHAAQNSPRAIV